MAQMDQATQQNAALVEESAAAAESLKVQARQLVDAVAVFKLAPGTGRVTPITAAPREKAPVEARTMGAGPQAAKVVRMVRPPAASVPVPAPKAAPAPVAAAATGTDDWESF